MNRARLPGTIFCLLLLLCATPNLAAERVALVGTGGAAATSQIIELATAALSGDKTIELVDRASIDDVIREQKLSLAGFVDRGKLLQIGKLVKADVFAIVDTDRTGGQALGLVI